MKKNSLNQNQLSSEMLDRIAALLGRQPRGLEAVEVWDNDGNPAVIRVASLVDNKPFPTLFWLIDKSINYQIDQLEAGGLINELQVRVDESDAFKQRFYDDHARYIQLREKHMSAAIKQQLQALSYYDSLQKRGIGGIANFSRIRCLHTYYAAHLVQPNTLGQWLDAEFLNKDG